MPKAPKGTPLAERIRRLVNESEAGCWLWQGRITVCGYGQMTVAGQRKEYAHRVSYATFTGPIPDGMAIDHKCEIKSCVNPRHLELVSYSENTRRWWASRRRAQGAIA